jgi:hypothetical protein
MFLFDKRKQEAYIFYQRKKDLFMNIKNKDIYVSSVYKLGESSEDLGDVEEVEK